MARHLYDFGPYRLDVLNRRLCRGGEAVALTPKVFDALVALLERRDRVVDKAELLRLLWPDTVVEEANLTQTVFLLRKALTEAPDGRQYIDTVPRRGYRFAAEVRETCEESSRAPAPGRAENRSPALASAAILLLAAVVGAASFLGPHLRRFTAGEALGAADGPFQQMTMTGLGNRGRTTHAAISHDGRHVAYAAEVAGQEGLWMLHLTSGRLTEVLPASEFRYLGLTFSRDDQRIYYLRGHSIYVVPARGGPSREVLTGVEWPIAFSPDGTRFAFIREDLGRRENSLLVAATNGTVERTVATRKLPRYFRSVAWSPDGRTLACAAGTDARNKPMSIVTVAMEDGSEKPLLPESWFSVGQVAWVPSGKGIIMTARAEPGRPSQVWLVSYPEGQVRRLTNDLDDYGSLSADADLTALVAIRRQRAASLWVISAGGGEARQITSGASLDERPRWGPDERIVYESWASGNLDIWSITPDGMDRQQLTRDPHLDFSPAVSPDGRQVAFTSDRTGTRTIWTMDIDGGNQVQLTRGPGELAPDYSPDGEWVVYEAIGEGKPTLHRVPSRGGESVRVTNTFSRCPAVSPSGHAVATYSWDERPESPTRISVIPFAGGKPFHSFDFRRDAFTAPIVRWTRDGRALSYVENRNGISDIYVHALDGDAPRPVTGVASDRIFNFDWSPDGKRVVCSRGVVADHPVLIRTAAP